MQENGTLYYLLGDFLRSNSIITDTDASGQVISQTKYKAWGEVRYSSGMSPTDFTFTGQKSDSYINMLDYGSRHYDPALGRFAQADTIVPPGAQGYDRYAYAANNPIRYNDPTGHRSCDYEDEGGNCKAFTNADYKKSFQAEIKSKFGWKVADDFLLKELQTILQTGNDILAYANSVTGGKGQQWINEYLGGTTITRWEGNNYQTWPGWLVGENTIYISQGDLDGRWFSHELGHIWDINTGEASIFGSVNGVSDWLNTAIGGDISGTPNFRFLNSYGKPADSHIPPSMDIAGVSVDTRFSSSVANGYGNGSTADYLAETFSWNVTNPANAPAFASAWVDGMIIAQAQSIP